MVGNVLVLAAEADVSESKKTRTNNYVPPSICRFAIMSRQIIL